jgi:hypothetical protein
MYVDISVFKSENNKRKEAVGDAKMLHHKGELKSKVENSELGLDKDIVKDTELK